MSTPDSQENLPESVQSFRRTGEFSDSQQAFDAMGWAISPDQPNPSAESRIVATANELAAKLRVEEESANLKPESQVSPLIEP